MTRARRSRASGLVARFARGDGGVAAVEFALLVPALIALWFGMTEFCQGFMAQKRLGHATSQVADIVAQSTQTSRDQIDDVFAIGALIMDPFPGVPLSLRVSSVTRDAQGVARVDWSRASEGSELPARGRTSVMTIPDGLIENGETIIVSEAQYDYTSPLTKFLPSEIEFDHTYYLRPRLVAQIACTDC